MSRVKGATRRLVDRSAPLGDFGDPLADDVFTDLTGCRCQVDVEATDPDHYPVVAIELITNHHHHRVHVASGVDMRWRVLNVLRVCTSSVVGVTVPGS